MTDKPTVQVPQDVADKMYAVIYDEDATPGEIWDAIAAARGPMVDAGISGCNDGSYLGPCGVTHFSTGAIGHMYYSTILDRVNRILGSTFPAALRISAAQALIEESWDVTNDRIDKLTQEREERVGRY